MWLMQWPLFYNLMTLQQEIQLVVPWYCWHCGPGREWRQSLRKLQWVWHAAAASQQNATWPTCLFPLNASEETGPIQCDTVWHRLQSIEERPPMINSSSGDMARLRRPPCLPLQTVCPETQGVLLGRDKGWLISCKCCWLENPTKLCESYWGD